MSELKAYTHVAEELDAETNKYALYAYDLDGNRKKIDDTELVYLKSDVDKAIAELEESHKKEVGQLLIEIAGLKEKYKELAKLHDKAIQACCDADKAIAQSKYKRCLAMADMCNAKYDKEDAMKYWERWSKRWLEIAKKFKHNN